MNDIYDGEAFDGGVLAAVAGWQECGFQPSPAWTPVVAPSGATPDSLQSALTSNKVPITVDLDYSVAAITQVGLRGGGGVVLRCVCAPTCTPMFTCRCGCCLLWCAAWAGPVRV